MMPFLAFLALLAHAPAQADHIEEMIERLGDDRPDVRDKAELALRKSGPPAMLLF